MGGLLESLSSIRLFNMASSASQLSQLKDFLGYLATIKGDLSNVTAPPFVLAQKSATEFPAAWCSHQDLFLAQGAPDDPAERALGVLKNFLASLKTQTYAGTSEKDGAKKPLNAFLGELFIAQFESDGRASTKLISEQVSHHPPVTACYLYNQEAGISAEGYVAQESTFSPTHGVKVRQIGHALVRLAAHNNETHLLTLPTLNVKSILSGSPYPELSGTCFITSSSGYTSRIEFEGKKLLGLSGAKNSVAAMLYRTAAPDEILYRVDGQWNDTFRVFAGGAADEPVESLDVNALALTPLHPAPLAEQDPWETRRAWGPVFDAIRAGDVQGVAERKGRIEEAQRAMRRAEEQDGTAWAPRFFRRVDDDEMARGLARTVGQELDVERTAGIWRFVGVDEADRIQRPFHPGVEPTGPSKA